VDVTGGPAAGGYIQSTSLARLSPLTTAVARAYLSRWAF
jgi:hypothetical protein